MPVENFQNFRSAAESNQKEVVIKGVFCVLNHGILLRITPRKTFFQVNEPVGCTTAESWTASWRSPQNANRQRSHRVRLSRWVGLSRP